MSGSWLVSCFNKYVGVRDLYSPSCWLSNKWSAHLRIVCSNSSPASTHEVLYMLYRTQCKQLPIPLFQHRPCILTQSPMISQTNWFNFFKRLWCNSDGVSSVSWLSFTILHPLT
jgi:hypothetical protein